MPDWMTAEDVMSRLGIRPQTLYAYVSRGRLRAEPDPSHPRRRRYSASDVAALAARRSQGRKASEVAAGAIAFGEPVLVSAITTIARGRLYYRGRDAAVLAQTETLESVARLLRGGYGVALKSADRPAPPMAPSARARAFAALAERAGSDAPGRGRAPLALAIDAATLLDVLADAITGVVAGGAIHRRIGMAWGLGGAGPDTELIREALVLLADHELNASTFAARVTASTGASLAAAALSGLCALSGPLHGGMAARVQNLVDEAGREGEEATVAGRLARGVGLPGFGHPLYPDGDPRAAALMAHFSQPAPFERLRRAALAASGQEPNIDYALVALAHRLRLPTDAPFALFAMARCAGWIAHAMEQLATGALIRPRARYRGPEPE